MAKYTVVHTCEHEWVHDITGGKPFTWPWQAKQRAQMPCPPCKQEQTRAAIAEVNATSAAYAGEREWPALTGTDRQVAWATTIRGDFLDALPGKLAGLLSAARMRGQEFTCGAEAIELIRQIALERTDAAWWIEHKARPGTDLMTLCRRRLAAAGPAGVTARALLHWTQL